MYEPVRQQVTEDNRQDRLLNAFSSHLRMVELVRIGDHDPLSCADCNRWCAELAQIEFAEYRLQVIHGSAHEGGSADAITG